MMFLLVIAYLGGVLTILSPCILPVLPFVFLSAGQPFVKSTLPMLAGMAITFAAVATLAAVGGSWAVHANEFGRYVAIALLAVTGLMLLSPQVAAVLTRPIVAFGNRIVNSTGRSSAIPGMGRSLLLGVATGMLWAPCAGPILGLVLTGAALQGANASTTFFLLAYSAGAATSLAVALLIGGRVFAAMKQSLGAGEWFRRGLGIAVLSGVTLVGFGADVGVLARIQGVSTSKFEQSLVDAVGNDRSKQTAEPGDSGMLQRVSDGPQPYRSNLPIEGQFPSLDGAVEWLNSPPLTKEQLRGKVVLVDFWTFSCINCIHTVPYVRAWAEKYKDQGLVVIGVHAPEFAYEKKIDNVKKAVKDFGLDYPVAVDNNYKIWRAFDNSYWPAHYFIDAKGQIRYHHFGEGAYDESEKVIQDLLAEAKSERAENTSVKPDTQNAGALAEKRDHV
ncbi:cytochrome c biogenesis protein CcdA [Rhizobium sp. BK376]|nr:cytochrome c biogenesis protein CcdA [Rhizobium sp. BK376]